MLSAPGTAASEVHGWQGANGNGFFQASAFCLDVAGRTFALLLEEEKGRVPRPGFFPSIKSQKNIMNSCPGVPCGI
jgi:hypothetical protein